MDGAGQEESKKNLPVVVAAGNNQFVYQNCVKFGLWDLKSMKKAYPDATEVDESCKKVGVGHAYMVENNKCVYAFDDL